MRSSLWSSLLPSGERSSRWKYFVISVFLWDAREARFARVPILVVPSLSKAKVTHMRFLRKFGSIFDALDDAQFFTVCRRGLGWRRRRESDSQVSRHM